MRGKFLLLTHRGFGKRGKIPENSMEAFAASSQMGFIGHELDVRMTLDGVVVIFHGPDLSSTTGQKGFVEKKRFGELRKLNCGHYLDSDSGKTYAIPSLEEYLTRFGRHVFTNIEIKKEWYQTGWNLEKKVLELLHRYDCLPNVLISSFNLPSIHYIKNKYPEVRVGILIDKKRIPALWIPLLIRWIRPDSVHIHKLMATPRWIQYIHSHGCEVALWSVNEKKDLRKFRDLGVEIIITDNMELVQDQGL